MSGTQTHAEPLRLAWLIDSLVTGGAEKLVVTFAEEALRRPDLRLTILALSDQPGPFVEALRALGVDLVMLKAASLVSPRGFLALWRTLRARRIELVHAHLAAATILGSAVAPLLGAGFVTTIHNVRPSARRQSRVREALHRAALRRPGARLVAVGHAVAEANAAEAGARPFTVVPNAVPESSVWRGGDRVAARAEMGAGPDETLLLAVGLLIPQKAYPDLIDAFALLADARPGLRLAIAGAGDGVYAPTLEARAAERGLGGRVRFLGLRRDVPRLLAAADLFVSASHWEGAPVSLLEAMINGAPCVMTDVGDNRLILEGTGCPTPPAGDPQAFAAALETMLDDPARRAACAEAARRRAREAFGVAAWVDRLTALYAETTRRKDWRRAPGAALEATCAS
jgi:L-malate glycosyltransferase